LSERAKEIWQMRVPYNCDGTWKMIDIWEVTLKASCLKYCRRTRIGNEHEPVTSSQDSRPSPTDHLPFLDIYLEIANTLLESGGYDLRILIYAGVGLRREGLAAVLGDLPFWVPDFTSEMRFIGMVKCKEELVGKTNFILDKQTPALEFQACIVDLLACIMQNHHWSSVRLRTSTPPTNEQPPRSFLRPPNEAGSAEGSI
jgi:hypothetical protein